MSLAAEALFGEFEELDDELVPYVEELDRFGTSIRHPLVYSIFHHDQLNAHVNKMLRLKKEALAKAEAGKDWHSYAFLHERPYRVDAFKRIRARMTNAEYWDLLGTLWIDSENIRQNPRVWQGMLGSSRPERHMLMNEDEQADLAAMPDVILVFQGHTDQRYDGWSWTINHPTARWFAKRFANLEGDRAVMTSGVIDKSDIVAYFSRRNESEIVIPRSKVRDKYTHKSV